jgi:hypothetical protein
MEFSFYHGVRRQTYSDFMGSGLLNQSILSQSNLQCSEINLSRFRVRLISFGLACESYLL